jgi:DNA processing protein
MKEPPVFFEFKGEPFWRSHKLISVVGSRQIAELSKNWMKNQLSLFLQKNDIAVVSGGAIGIDQLAHLVAVKNKKPTIFVLPSGIENKYPNNLIEFEKAEFSPQTCFLSEFESNQRIHKSHFYFRNRLIAALGELTLIVQASLKSGSLLTVHHCLENGKPLLVIPSHPEIIGFEGNLKLIREGAYPITSEQDLLDFWNAEFHAK